MSNGKGDTRRPEDATAIASNWDRIFPRPMRRDCPTCLTTMTWVRGEDEHYWRCPSCHQTAAA